MRSYSIVAAALLAAKSAMAATATTATGVEEPSAVPTLGAAAVQGCFSSKGDLVFNSTQLYNSKSKCALDICAAMGKPVAGTMGGDECYCGDEYPPKSTLANDTDCNIGCSGYDLQACGGDFYWTIYNTGLTLVVEYESDSALSSSASSVASSTSTSSSSTGTATSAAATTSAGHSGSGHSSTDTTGIAVGVVCGVVAVAGVLGGLFFFLRRRRNREIEEEHRRNAAVNAFINGAKPPGSSGGYSMTDARLDPVMAQRRVSNGSIADNEDYSRRILRVTNA